MTAIPYTMKTNSEMLQELHAIVWRYRAELEDYWPTPTQSDALLFAFTEVAEAIDAHLRLESAYKRNHDKTLSVEDELADAAMMLLTALGPKAQAPRSVISDVPLKPHEYAYVIGEMIYQYTIWVESHLWQRKAWQMIIKISRHPDINLAERLTARLERIKAKQMNLHYLQPKGAA